MAEKMMASDINKYRPSACVFGGVMEEPRFIGFYRILLQSSGHWRYALFIEEFNDLHP